MMKPSLIALALAGLLVSGCSTISSGLDAINPFSSGPKFSPLPTLTAASETRVQWDLDAGKAGGYTFTPAIVGKTLYAAGAKGYLQKVEDGRRVWRIEVNEALSAGVGANDDIVVVGTPEGEVLAFATADGKPLWRARVSSEVLAAPVVGPDGVAVRSGDNSIYLFDLKDGSRKWVYQRAMPSLAVRSTASPVFADRYIFAGFPGGKLLALSLQNGAPVWEGVVALPKGATELDRVADVAASPVVDGTQVCAVAFQGRVACFDMSQGGATIWSRDISSASGLTMDARYVFVTDDQGIIYGLDRMTGGSLWKQDKLKRRQVTAPVVRLGMLAVGDIEGVVHFLSREEGHFVAQRKTDGSPIKAAPQFFAGAFLVQTSGGELSAIEVK